eukprot:scaffold92413_cov31-Tisochrysis_lutea.AAC.1
MAFRITLRVSETTPRVSEMHNPHISPPVICYAYDAGRPMGARTHTHRPQRIQGRKLHNASLDMGYLVLLSLKRRLNLPRRFGCTLVRAAGDHPRQCAGPNAKTKGEEVSVHRVDELGKERANHSERP